MRENGAQKALVISATGTGETYLSAFDVRQVNPERVLFIVHREQILSKSLESFQRVLGFSQISRLVFISQVLIFLIRSTFLRPFRPCHVMSTCNALRPIFSIIF